MPVPASVLLFALLGTASADDAIARGELLAGVAGCLACHTADDGVPGAGGHRLDTPYGVFVGPNITTDPDAGIGAWTQDDFVAAMRRGRAPDGRHYYPSFPYGSFTGMTDADLADLWAWLQQLSPDPRPDEPHELTRYKKRGALAFWKLLELKRGPLEPDDAYDDQLNRGRYLVEAVAHCGECHTPRNGIGGLKDGKALAGGTVEPEPGPDIRPGAPSVAGWSHEDWITFLELGMTPEGDFVGGEMGRVVREGTARLDDADRTAVARWLREGVEPHESHGENATGQQPP